MRDVDGKRCYGTTASLESQGLLGSIQRSCLKPHCHRHGSIAAIGDLSGKVTRISLIEEAWHIGLHHQLFASDEVYAQAAILEVFGVGHALDMPTGEQVGSRKGKGSASLLIGT